MSASNLENSISITTRRTEHENRNGAILDQTLRELRRKLQNDRKHLPTPGTLRNIRQRSNKAEGLLNEQINAVKVQLSEIQTRNRYLRNSIDETRRAKMEFNREAVRVHRSLSQIKSNLKDTNMVVRDSSKQELTYKQKAIRNSHDLIKLRRSFSEQSRMLDSQLKVFNLEYMVAPRKRQKHKSLGYDSETLVIFRFSAANLEEAVKSKRSELNNYIKTTQIHRSALQQLMKINQLHSFSEVSQEFAKSYHNRQLMEAQLLTYDTDIHAIQSEISQNKRKINEVKKSGSIAYSEELKRLEEAKYKLEKTKLQVMKNEQMLQGVNGGLSGALPVMQEIDQMLRGLNQKGGNIDDSKNAEEMVQGLDELMNDFLIIVQNQASPGYYKTIGSKSFKKRSLVDFRQLQDVPDNI